MNRTILLVIILTLYLVPCLAQEKELPKLIPFEVKENYGYINEKSLIIIKPKFDYADNFYEGLAQILKDSQFGFIDYSGKYVISPQYY